MNQIPERTLYPSRAKFIFLLLVFLLFTLGGIQAASAGEQWGHLVYLICGLSSAACVLIMRKQTNYLKLGDNEFEIATLAGKRRIKWEDVDSFGLASVYMRNLGYWTLIGWDYKKGVSAPPLAILGSTTQNKRVVGKEDTLPDT
ncbi:MAG: hypothetical protein VX173_08240 [Pseudomonadota bacterium]|nr:hypothetical protein [Pseudomonadota bacterium]